LSRVSADRLVIRGEARNAFNADTTRPSEQIKNS
jgi:hypothetical protein